MITKSIDFSIEEINRTSYICTNEVSQQSLEKLSQKWFIFNKTVKYSIDGSEEKFTN